MEILKWLGRTIFKNAGRVFSFLALLVSLGSAVFAYQAASASDHNNVEITLILGIVVVVIVVLAAFLSIHKENSDLRDVKFEAKNVEDQLQESKKRITQIGRRSNQTTRALHNLAHETRDYTIQMYYAAEDFFGDTPAKEKKQILREALARSSSFDIYHLNNVKEIFDIASQQHCSVHLKLIEYVSDLINDGTTDIHVRTHMRDSISHKRRIVKDFELGSFPYHTSTAFKRIVDHDYSDKEFFEDHLRNVSYYEDSFRDWDRYYDARAVVALRNLLIPKASRILGFLSVDNFGGGLANETAKELLNTCADIYTSALITRASIIMPMMMEVSPDGPNADPPNGKTPLPGLYFSILKAGFSLSRENSDTEAQRKDKNFRINNTRNHAYISDEEMDSTRRFNDMMAAVRKNRIIDKRFD